MVLLSNSLLVKASTNIMEYSKDRQDSILPTIYTFKTYTRTKHIT
jgi:hypothetical protein